MRRETGPNVRERAHSADGGEAALYAALTEELRNLREYDTTGAAYPITDDVLARALARRLFQQHGFRKVFKSGGAI